MGITLGNIHFDRNMCGMGVGQKWNPNIISGEDRKIIAKTLREIADALDTDKFEVDQIYVHFPPPK